MRVHGKPLDKVVESDVTLCDRSLVEQLELEGKPGNVFLTTQKMKDSPKNGLEVLLSIESISVTQVWKYPKPGLSTTLTYLKAVFLKMET